MANYNSNYTGLQIDNAVMDAINAAHNGGIVSTNALTTQLNNYVTSNTLATTLTPYLKVIDANNTYLNKTDANNTYLNKTDANNTYLNKTDANNYILKTELLDLIYPIGAIYISTIETNPSTFIGGTWVAFATGRTLIGVGTATDANGLERTFSTGDSDGEYTHTLSVTEMPAHKHAYQEYRAGEVGYVPANSHANSITVRTDVNGINNTGGTFTDRSSGYYYNGNLIQNTGDGSAHNNLPPYITVYIWKRIA